MRCSVRRLLGGCGVMGAMVAAVLAALLAIPGTALAQAGPERIVSYDIAIAIEHDGASLVTEQIVYDFGGQSRHGIFRQIPVRFSYNSSYDRVYPVTVVSVRSPDAPSQYTVSSSGSSVTIRIGDPSQTITGTHTYQIRYLIRGTLNGFASHDELYWNAIGGQWNVPIERATVRVTAPGTVTRAACYAGPPGSTTPCGRASVAGTAAIFTQTWLAPHEGLTVVVAFPKGLVVPLQPVLAARWSLQRAFAFTPVSAGVAGALLAVFAAFATVILIRRRARRYPEPTAQLAGTSPGQPEDAVPLSGRGLPVLESAPPAGLRPAQASVVLDGMVKACDIAGTIVDLAVRGYLRIEDPPSSGPRPDWGLIRLDKTGGLLPYEQAILDAVFADTTKSPDSDAGTPSIRFSDLGAEFVTALKGVRDALYSNVTSSGWFTARPDRVRRAWRAWGVFTAVIGVITVVAAAAFTRLALVPVPLVLAGLAMICCAHWMPVRTALGSEMARRVLGFRKWLVISAAGQGSLTAQPGTLYDYLPYAIALECMQGWADLTASLAGEDQAGQAPLWYGNRDTFSPRRLTSLSYSAYYFSRPHTIALTVGQQLASSSASGSSGFGGGGYSGGGGGGGGGGSW
jgi:uncharacterized membrane protein YgcG